jgi:peptide chain release factor 3
LKNEYGVECVYEPVNTVAARWISCDDKKVLESFKEINGHHLALNSGDNLAYLAPSRVNLEIAIEQWKDIEFHDTREH